MRTTCHHIIRIIPALTLLLLLWAAPGLAASFDSVDGTQAELEKVVQLFSSWGDRSTGSEGAAKAADYIEKEFRTLKYNKVGVQEYTTAVRVHGGSTLTVGGSGRKVALYPFLYNEIQPQTVAPGEVRGPLIWVNQGTLTEMNGKTVKGSVILMDMASARNWTHAAMLGAEALILVDRGESSKGYFEQKKELTPLDFPIFYLTEEQAQEAFYGFRKAENGLVLPDVSIESDVRWKNVDAENVWCYQPGTDERMAEQLLVIQAPYDSQRYIAGLSPGADESLSAAGLIQIAKYLKANPPARSVLLVATSGQGHAQAGMREFIWASKIKGKRLRDIEKIQKNRAKNAQITLDFLSRENPVALLDNEDAGPLKEALETQLKNEIDKVSTNLMRLRLVDDRDVSKEIKRLADDRFLLRRLMWREDYTGLTKEEQDILSSYIDKARVATQAILKDAKRQIVTIKSSRKMRSVVAKHEVASSVSLLLSSHGDGIGGFSYGFMYNIRPDRNRNPAYSLLGRILSAAAPEIQKKKDLPDLYKDTLRPSRIRPWQSYFIDRPFMGGEVSALANWVGFTFATTSDARPYWGTPFDLTENVNFKNASQQVVLIQGLLNEMAQYKDYLFSQKPRIGISELEGRAQFIRQGELFPDQAAPGTVVQAYQGPAVMHAIADASGTFKLRGICDKKNTFYKVVLEAYRFDDKGKIIWAVDKKQTGKNRYRVKMTRRLMETDLIMFACKQITIFNLLEPRNFNYLPRLNIFDGNREALPVRYWFSRIDTYQSTMASFFMEPGAPIKLTLSDSVLSRKLILLNSETEKPEGSGYLPAEWPSIPATEFRIAQDMWGLLGPRISNLEKHGIVNDRIRALQDEGMTALSEAKQAFENEEYDTFLEQARTSWALASRVYNDVEKTQKDVLIGVLFYIALFVPFAWCMERVIFCFADIHKRIVAFLLILIAVIAVVYFVHPAFQLTYSPVVVILAFFIVGLSVMVSMIIVSRFEREMEELQKRSRHVKASEISRWKAFTAAFVIGVSNLRRRKLRTVLTSITLVILTFTIMSFTAVKSVRSQNDIQFEPKAPYEGILIKSLGWSTMPPEAIDIVDNKFKNTASVGPRIWVETDERTAAMPVPLSNGDISVLAEALVGLSHTEPAISGIDSILIGGRWFEPGEQNAVILPRHLCEQLGVSPDHPGDAPIELWGMKFKVVGVFEAEALRDHKDLDGEPLTPVIFRNASATQMSAAEAEAMQEEGGLTAMRDRYEHIAAGRTVIIPAGKAMAMGGKLKGFALKPFDRNTIRATARSLADRFGLLLFVGTDDGTYLYTASDSLNYAGVPNILIPLAISMLIVLNTMISSVYERRREIGVYTSIGMAPTHVSYLFVAEAIAFAVISVVLGYLLAQTTAGLLSGTALWSGMTANYSSLAGVFAMGLVISVVLISVIYPSKVAADIAIPDVNRSWTMPDDAHDIMDLTLPFLMKEAEQEHIGGFLYDYFKAHEDVSHGLFSSDAISIAFACPAFSPGVMRRMQEAGPDFHCLTLSARVWLAPFDFGVKQHVELIFCPSKEHDSFLEIRVRVQREAGEAGIWRRINKAFFNAIRKQLLIWRSLDPDVQEPFADVLMQAVESTGGLCIGQEDCPIPHIEHDETDKTGKA